MKKIITAIFSSLLLLVSCNQNLASLISGAESNKDYVTVCFNEFNSTSKLAAIPYFNGLKSDIQKIKILADAAGHSTVSVEVSPSATSGSLLIDFNITWHITVEEYDSNDKVVMKGEADFTPTGSDSSVSVTVGPYQQVSDGVNPGVNGSFKLLVKFLQETGVEYTIAWYVDGGAGSGKVIDVGSNSPIDYFEKSGLTPGLHRVNLDVKNNKYPSSKDTARLSFDVMIYSNAVSTKWIDTASGTAKDTLELSFEDLRPVTIEDVAFYIKGSGSNSSAEAVKNANNKKYAVQFDNVQDAVNSIAAADPDNYHYGYIYIDGKVTTSYNASKNRDDSIVAVGDSSHSRKIKITGVNNDADKDMIINASGSSARVVNVYADSTVEMSNIGISGGDTSGDGGGILCNGNLTFTDGKILNCQAKNGAGIMINNTASACLINSLIQNCTASVYGGAVYSKAEQGTGAGNIKTASYAKGSVFTSNSAEYGGAVAVEADSYLSLISCKTLSNTASFNASDTANGVYNSGTVYLDGNSKYADSLYLKTTASPAQASSYILMKDITKLNSSETGIAVVKTDTMTNGKVLFDADASFEISSSLLSYFSPADTTNWSLVTNASNTQIQLKRKPSGASGSITINSDELEFYLDKVSGFTSSDITLKYGFAITSDGSITTVEDGDESTYGITDFNINVYCDAQKIDSSLVSGFMITTSSHMINIENMPNETYRVEFTGKYKSQGFSANCYFTMDRP